MTTDTNPKEEKPPFVPVQFLGTYKLPDNSGQRAGIFQELTEGEAVFIMVMDNGVECRSLSRNEKKYVERVQAKEGISDEEVLESAATTLMKVGVGHNWDDDSRGRIMTILGLPSETQITIGETE